jgi:transcriptional regulator with XRE-family HTH domain
MVQERPVDPMVSEHRLLIELRSARQRRGLSQREVADQLAWSLSKVIRIEGGTNGVSLTDVSALAGLYQVGAEESGRMFELARAAREGRRRPEGQGQECGQSQLALSRKFRLFLAYEESATLMRYFNPLLIPGLLQTEEYARALLAGGFVVRPTRIDDKVAVRLGRRERLDRADPPQVDIVLDEAAIRRPVGGPEVMREQLNLLLELARRPSLNIRILPFGAGLYPGISGSFAVLEFDQPMAGPVVYLETPSTDTTIRHDAAAVEPYQAAFRQLQARALDAQGSLRLIESAIDELAGVAGHA